ncbi:MAG: hypothetical protein LKJ90_03925 [Faecalibacterium sp.]|jgi:hypothetical protein|nr:hypothetical protein [Faecalibacterium sp.]
MLTPQKHFSFFAAKSSLGKACYTALLASLAASLLLTGCGGAPAAQAPSSTACAPASLAASSVAPQSEAGAKQVASLPSSLDVQALDGCTFAASFTPKDVYLNDDGALVVQLTVYDYERFAPADIAALHEGDTLVIDGKQVAVQSVAQNEYGLVSINGGFEEDGVDLVAQEDGTYYEVSTDAVKSYFSIGQTVLAVSQDFKLIDNSDLENPGVETLPGDFLTEMSQADEDADTDFTANNTAVTVEGGKIISITKSFMP